MDLRLLRYLLAVVDAGTISRAAPTVYITQPSLSRQLRGLERQLGFAVFDRSRGRLILTPAGSAFIPVARDLVARGDAADRMATTLATGQSTQFNVVAPLTTISQLLAPFVASGGWDGPVIELRESAPAQAQAELDRSADLAVTTVPVDERLAWRAVNRAPIWAYVNDAHRWSSRSSIQIGELVREPLVLLSNWHSVRLEFDRTVLDARVMYSSHIECDLGLTAQAHAAAGRGIAVVSDFPRYGLVGIPIVGVHGAVHVNVHAAWQRDHYASEQIADLVNALVAFANQLPDPNPRRLRTSEACEGPGSQL